MDIEGGEMECLRCVDIEQLKNVREFIMEFHHTHLNDTHQFMYREIIGILQKAFKHVDYREYPRGAWVTNIYANQNSEDNI